MREDSSGFTGRINIAVCDNGDRHRVNNLRNGDVFRSALEAISPGATVYGDTLYARSLRDARDANAIAVSGVGPGADLQRNGHVNGLHHRLENAGNE